MKIIEEKGNGGVQSVYCADNLKISLSKQNNVNSAADCREKVLCWLKEIFLPQGYPQSVSSDYLQYQIWDSLQAYCSNLAHALSLHSTLVGIGVGKDTASPLAASLSWLTQDGAGMVSSITFAYWKGSDLDNNSKQWRLFADAANDASHFVKLLAPYLPFPFVLTFCFSSIISSVVGVAGGCTRASLVQHQALCNNTADVAAKDGSQETLVNLAGLITSLTLLPYLTATTFITWLTFVTCVVLHLYSNYRAMRTIQMKTLNRSRLLFIIQHWITGKGVPDIPLTNEKEPFFLGPAFKPDYMTSGISLQLGVSLGLVLRKCAEEELTEFLGVEQYENFSDEKYKIFVTKKYRKIFVVYHKEAMNLDILTSFFAAYLCAVNFCPQQAVEVQKSFIFKSGISAVSWQKIASFINQKSKSMFPAFHKELLDAGWKIDPLRLNVGEWRINIADSEDKKKK